MRTFGWLVLLVACGEDPGGGGGDTDGGGDDWQPVSYQDQGTVCVEDQGAGATVSVTVDDCMSSSCSRAFEGSCTATVDGATVTVTSDLHWEQNLGEGVACTDDCGIPTTSCEIADLPDGTYTVVLGGVETEVTLPATTPCGY
jgi:hypothetical protein